MSEGNGEDFDHPDLHHHHDHDAGDDGFPDDPIDDQVVGDEPDHDDFGAVDLSTPPADIGDDLAFPDDDAPPPDEIPDAAALWPDGGELQDWLGDDPGVDPDLDVDPHSALPHDAQLADALRPDVPTDAAVGDIAERVLRDRLAGD